MRRTPGRMACCALRSSDVWTGGGPAYGSANGLRIGVKRQLARLDIRQAPTGLTILIYHRVGGGTVDERDVPLQAFEWQLDLLAAHEVVSLDAALDALEVGDDGPRIVLTFDDGFVDVYDRAWPLLRERSLPFTVYVATAYADDVMTWEGSTAQGGGRGMTWDQLGELAESPLCTLGNHTHRHVRPPQLTEVELDECSSALLDRVGVSPRHFAYPWGKRVHSMEDALRCRFRSAATGRVGRNHPSTDPMRLRRVPVRATDPSEFFVAKLHGHLLPERLYGGLVATAKRAAIRA